MKNKILEKMYKQAEDIETKNKKIVNKYINDIEELSNDIDEIKKKLISIHSANEKIFYNEMDFNANFALQDAKNEIIDSYKNLIIKIEELAKLTKECKRDTY
jgi:DNA-binding protein H-NS